MHIKAVCPQCGNAYQVNPDLKGKRMRCLNSICRAIFEIQDPAQAAPQPPLPAAPSVPSLPPAKAGASGSIVPILPAEMMPASQEIPPSAPPALRAPRPRSEPVPAAVIAAPPVQNPFDDLFAGAKPVSQSGPDFRPFAGPDMAGQEQPPPVRQGLNGSFSSPPVDGFPNLPLSVAPGVDEMKPHGHSLRGPIALVTLLLLTAAGVSAWLITAPAPTSEDEGRARAEKDYKEHNFAEAAGQFRSLVHGFPQSERRPAYQFHAELSDIRDAIHRTQLDADETLRNLERLRKFVEIYDGDPLLKTYMDDISASLYRLVEDMTGFAASTKERSLLEIAKLLSAEANKKFKPAPLIQQRNINTAFDAAELVVIQEEKRKRVLATLQQFNEAPSLAAVEQAAQLAEQNGLATDAEIQTLVKGLPEKHLKSIKFDPDLAADSVPGAIADRPPSLAVLPFRGQQPATGTDSHTQPAFALVRGVLYALDPNSGKFRWARRVGADSTALPVWLPATSVTPDSVLIASPQEGGLLALNGNDGSVRWRQLLPETCTGQPLLFGNRVFVACRPGTVYEIDLASGRRLGGYLLGEDLIHGGVVQSGTNNVCFAANRGCVYMLDVSQRQCTAILYAGQRGGSLRCSPTILALSRGEMIDPGKAGPPLARLLLCQGDGQQGTRLMSYALPIGDPFASPIQLGERLPGRTWYPPFSDTEQFSLITDAGAFGVFGLRQRDNLDAEVFSMFRESLPPPASGAGEAKPMTVHADGQNFWVLAYGRLHHFQVSMSAHQGWRIVGRPLTHLALGSALHAAQVLVDDRGHTSLYLVTESSNGRACWMTAVDLDRHSIRWQRQIGLVPQGAPVAVDGKVVAWDREGDLLVFDSEKAAKLQAGSWQTGGRVTWRDPAAPAWLLPHGDGKTVIAAQVQGTQLKVWKYLDGMTTAVSVTQALDAPLAGTPALMGDAVVLPLDNGRLARVTAKAVVLEDEWRSPLADKDALGHAVAVGPNKLACTDGSQGLVLWRLEGQGLSRFKTVKVKNRIIAPPAVLQGAALRLCVADVGRGVTLFRGDELTHEREWVLSGAVTAGPFARGGDVLVVVDGRRLVCLNPDSDKPRWASTVSADIIGEPQIIDGKLIVADQSGQIQALDPATGVPVGLGYKLRADVAPAATPLPFGRDRLFVPLTDGTVLLPARAWFHAKVFGVPVPR